MNKPKILVFEDEPVLLRMYVTKFKSRGFEVVSFLKPPQNVIDIIAQEKPDLISSGVIMPDIDGFSLLKNIKEDKRVNFIPFIFLTNLAQESDAYTGFQLGADKYICKSETTPGQVVDIFNKILNEERNEAFEIKFEKDKAGKILPTMRNIKLIEKIRRKCDDDLEKVKELMDGYNFDEFFKPVEEIIKNATTNAFNDKYIKEKLKNSTFGVISPEETTKSTEETKKEKKSIVFVRILLAIVVIFGFYTILYFISKLFGY